MNYQNGIFMPCSDMLLSWTDQVFTYMLSANLEQEYNFYSLVFIILPKDLLDFFSFIEETSHFSLQHILPHFANHKIYVTHWKRINKLQALKRQGVFSTSRWAYRPYIQPSSGIFQSWKCQAFIWFICKALTIIGTLWSYYLPKKFI